MSTEIRSLPVEILDKILLEAAILRASKLEDDNAEVYRDLASVCRLWRNVIETDHFRRKFIRLIVQCMLV